MSLLNVTSVVYKYGLPADGVAGTPGDSGKRPQAVADAYLHFATAWMAFTAAYLPNTNVSQQILERVWKFASFNGTSGPFAATYNVENGAFINGTTR